jgi:DNA-binding SARP family transcriptional activator
MSVPDLRIRLLGPLEVLDGEDRVALPPSRKTRALLTYLVATERPHARSALCDLFWQNVHDPRAGLRWALSKLRSALTVGGMEPIGSARDQVEFKSNTAEVDLLTVRALVPGDPNEASTEALKEAGRAFRGEFVEGLELPRCHEYEAWCLGVREGLRRLHVSIHHTLSRRLRSDPEAAIHHAYARLAVDPYSEEAYITAMEILADAGRADRGLELYDRCRSMLSRRLRAPPSEALEVARRRLRSDSPPQAQPRPKGGSVGGTDAVARALAALPEPEHLPHPRKEEPPLVGRTVELQALSSILRRSAADGTGRAVLVTGEPGIGKTRLLREVAARVRASGGWVLSGPVFESEEVRSYGPWIDLLRKVPSVAIDPEVRGSLSGLLGELGRDPDPGGPTERVQLFDAAAHLLRRLAEARAPALVILDDAQWLDSSSTALLHYLVRTLKDTPLVFTLASQEAEIRRGSAMARMLRSLKEGDHLDRIDLRPLGAEDTEALVRALDTSLDSSWVFAVSEGNPFFALALAASLREGVQRTPGTVRDELHDRLARLDAGARSLLPWAAALGRAFDVPTLVRVVERPAHDVVSAMHELERRGIVRAIGADRFDFVHSLLRQAAYDRPSKPVRRQIHRSIANALDGLERGQGRMPGALAHHAELGGLPAVAAAAYAEAAQDSLWVFAFDEAAILVERGLAQAGQLSGESRIALEMDLLRIYCFRSMQERRPGDAEDRVRRIVEQAASRSLTSVVARGHACLMELQYQRGAYHHAGESSLLYAEAGRESGPGTAARALSEAAACLLLLDQAPDDARRLAEEASRVVEEHGLEVEAVALARALLHHHHGELPEASRAFQEVARLCRRTQDRWWEIPAITRRLMVALDQGDAEGARTLAVTALDLAERMHDQVEGVFARGLGAIAAVGTEEGVKGEDGESDELRELDDALRELRELDSLWKIAQLQTYAAEIDIRRGRVHPARRRAEEALEAAQALKRPSLVALSLALLARCAAMDGDLEAAARHLDAPEMSRPEHRLSYRARTEIERAREVVAAGISNNH